MTAKRPARVFRADHAEQLKLVHDPTLVDRLARGMYETDTAADAVVDAFAALPGGAGWALLDRALAEGIAAMPEAPAELRVMLEPVLAPPAWVNFDRVDAGATAFARAGVLHGLSYLQVLLSGFELSTLNKPLVRTGRMEYMASRRMEETTRWGLRVFAPSAMRPGGDGIRAAVRLRLVHALIRSRLRNQPDWDFDNWGEPINQAHNAATLGGAFMTVPIRLTQDAGIRYSPADLDAICHYWAWVGHLLGLPEDLLPQSFERTEALLDIIQDLDPGPDADSRDLAQATLRHALAPERILPTALQRPAAPLLRPVTAHVLGAITHRSRHLKHHRVLGIPGAHTSHLFPLIRPLVWSYELARTTGALGSDADIARTQIMLLTHAINAVGGAPRELQPEDQPQRQLRGTLARAA